MHHALLNTPSRRAGADDFSYSKRFDWMYSSRGIIVLIIAIYHTALQFSFIGVSTTAVVSTISPLINTGMGLFFLIAGFNSRKYIDGTLKAAWRRRLGPLLWILTVWVTIYWLYSSGTIIFHRNLVDIFESIAKSFAAPSWELWFIWSVTVYFVVSMILKKASPKYIVFIFGIVGFVGLCTSDYHLKKYGLGWFANNYNLRSAASYYIFFYCGHKYAEYVINFSNYNTKNLGIFTFSIGLLAIIINSRYNIVVVNAPMNTIALLCGIVSAASLGKILSGSKIIRGIGMATLPIYLISPILIHICVKHIGLYIIKTGINIYVISIFVGFTCSIISLLLAYGLGPSRTSLLFKPPVFLVAIHDNIVNRFNEKVLLVSP